MNVNLDNPRTLKMRNGLVALSFSVVLWDEDGIQTLSNFRLMDGQIHAPAIQLSKTKQYVPIYYTGRPIAEKIYGRLVRKGWLEQYEIPLADLDHAIQPILLTLDVIRKVAPGGAEDISPRTQVAV